MALVFSPYIYGTLGIASIFMNGTELFNNARRIYVYPTSVAYPNAVPTIIPANPILTFNVDSSDFQQANGTISLKASVIAVAANTANPSTLGWCLVTNLGVGGNTSDWPVMITDSLSLSGQGGAFIFSSLTASNGESIALSTMNITLGPLS